MAGSERATCWSRVMRSAAQVQVTLAHEKRARRSIDFEHCDACWHSRMECIWRNRREKKLTTQILRPSMLTNADNDRRRHETWDCYGSSSSWDLGQFHTIKLRDQLDSLARNKHTPQHTQGGVSAPTPQILRSNSVFLRPTPYVNHSRSTHFVPHP